MYSVLRTCTAIPRPTASYEYSAVRYPMRHLPPRPSFARPPRTCLPPLPLLPNCSTSTEYTSTIHTHAGSGADTLSPTNRPGASSRTSKQRSLASLPKLEKLDSGAKTLPAQAPSPTEPNTKQLWPCLPVQKLHQQGASAANAGYSLQMPLAAFSSWHSLS
jgi:hypothetical protein